jgi:hypothetical protein
MAQKADWTYWKTGLHQDSEALADLDTLAQELGVSRAEATRFLVVAFSKAKRGEWNPLFSGFQAQTANYHTAGATALQPQPGRAPIPIRQDEKEVQVQARKSKGAAFAKALDLDD